MKKILYYHFLNWNDDRPRRKPSVWDYRTENPSDRRRNPLEEPYKNYGKLLKNNDFSVDKGEVLVRILFEETIPSLLPQWNLKHSFEFRPMPLKISYFGPGSIRLGVSKALNSRTSTYVFSFARFFGGDFWINDDYFAQHGFNMTPIKEQVRLTLANLPQGRHPKNGGRERTLYRFGTKGKFYFKNKEVTSFKERRTTSRGQRMVAPGGGTYLIRSYTTP